MTSVRIAAFVTMSLVLVALTGCAVEPMEDGSVGSAQEAAMSSNAMSSNAMSSNAMSSNAMSSNALNISALSSTALASLQDPSPTGDLFRQLISYTVGCALDPSQSFSYSYTDDTGTVQNVTDVGQLGLYPDWATEALTDVGKQQNISACLAARTNYFGITVDISVRGSPEVLQANTPPSELAAYPDIEGAFWGNLFTATPSLYSCYNVANAANSNADNRVCATGYTEASGQVVPCGMITLTGDCDDQCEGLDETGQFYLNCGNASSHSITIGLAVQ